MPRAKVKAPKLPPPKIGQDKYGVSSLHIGDSKFIPFDGRRLDIIRRSIQATGTRRGRKYASRIMHEDGVDGIRVWRTL